MRAAGLAMALAVALPLAGGCAATDPAVPSIEPAVPAEPQVWTLPTHGVWGPEGATEFQLRSDMTRAEVEAVVSAPGARTSLGFVLALTASQGCISTPLTTLEWVSRSGTLHVMCPGDSPSFVEVRPPGHTSWEVPPGVTLRWGMSREDVEASLQAGTQPGGTRWSGIGRGTVDLQWHSVDGTETTAMFDRDRLGEFLIRVETRAR